MPVKSWQSKGQGPAIALSYTELDGKIYREASGVEMNRRDVILSDGPHDWEWEDLKKSPGKPYRIWRTGDQNKTQVPAPLGQSVWQHGPNVPANANCKSCHRFSSVNSGGVSFASLAKLGPVEASLGLAVGMTHGHGKTHTKPPTKPTVVVPGPAGPRGPIGPAGDAGENGNDGDVSVIIAWLEAHKHEFKGKDGENGNNGTDGKAATVSVGTVTTVASTSPATVTNAGSELAAVLNFTIPRGTDGTAGDKGEPGTAGVTEVNDLKTEIEKLKTHQYQIVITDKDGKPAIRADGEPSVITFSFTKDGEMRVFPVPVVAPK